MSRAAVRQAKRDRPDLDRTGIIAAERGGAERGEAGMDLTLLVT